MKAKAKNIVIMIAILLAWGISVAGWMQKQSGGEASVISEESFLSDMSAAQEEEKVGANIWLKQSIHGTDGIHYRYVIKTDCPQWDFETRYMTDAPIEWVDETSAVEVVIYDTQVRFEGTVYASGQYYTIPLLGGLSSESISLEEWQDNLAKQAYQAYVSEAVSYTKSEYGLFVLLWVVPAIAVYWLVKKLKKAAAKDQMVYDMCENYPKAMAGDMCEKYQDKEKDKAKEP